MSAATPTQRIHSGNDSGSGFHLPSPRTPPGFTPISHQLQQQPNIQTQQYQSQSNTMDQSIPADRVSGSDMHDIRHLLVAGGTGKLGHAVVNEFIQLTPSHYQS